MARIRTIKPDFFKNEDLAELPMSVRLLFIGLWTQADREGKLEDRPKRIKAELFPYEDIDIEKMLDDLQMVGLIQRYKVESSSYILITNFLKHQQPNMKEAKSVIPNPTQCKHSESTVQASQERKGKEGNKEGNGKDYVRDDFFEISVLKFFGFSEMPFHNQQQKILLECCRAQFSKDSLDFFKKQCEGYMAFNEIQGSQYKFNFYKFLGKQENRFEDGLWQSENWDKKRIDRLNKGSTGKEIGTLVDKFSSIQFIPKTT